MPTAKWQHKPKWELWPTEPCETPHEVHEARYDDLIEVTFGFVVTLVKTALWIIIILLLFWR